MQTRAARLVLLVMFIAAMSVAAYLFWKGESQAAAEAAQAKVFDASATTAQRVLLEIRAAQPAYVAAGQGGDVWAAKVAQGLESVRRSIVALRKEAISTRAQSDIDEAASALEDFGRIDRRALEYVRNSQRLLASDLIFTDGLEVNEATLASLEQARAAELLARAAAAETFTRRQVFALTAGAASALLTVLLLLPRAEPERVSAPAGNRTTSPRPESWRIVPAVQGSEGDSWSPPRRAAAPTDAAEPPPTAAVATTDFVGVASLCVDLARVVDTRALPSLLDRTASLLDASGIILWIADPDGRELNPIFAQGYPQQLVNRLGTIPRDAENATAAAFRTSLLQTVRADEISAGAIAAPLVTPGGCVGVMAAEVRHEAERQDMKLAAATIVAAQLATLVGPPSARNHAKAGAAGA